MKAAKVAVMCLPHAHTPTHAHTRKHTRTQRLTALRHLYASHGFDAGRFNRVVHRLREYIACWHLGRLGFGVRGSGFEV